MTTESTKTPRSMTGSIIGGAKQEGRCCLRRVLRREYILDFVIAASKGGGVGIDSVSDETFS